jgi:hypothetical protein
MEEEQRLEVNREINVTEVTDRRMENNGDLCSRTLQSNYPFVRHLQKSLRRSMS